MAEANIYQKMLAIQTSIATVSKNLEVGFGSSKYKAVSEADVLRAVRKAEEEVGIYSYPAERRIVADEVFVTQSSKGTPVNNKFLRVETIYRFVDTDKPESYIEVTTYGDGIDSQDKAPGKAMTYADKYALLKAYKIVTGDDPDANASQEGTFKKKEVKEPQELTYRQKVMITAEEKGIGMSELAKDYGLTRATTEERFKEVLADLEKK